MPSTELRAIIYGYLAPLTVRKPMDTMGKYLAPISVPGTTQLSTRLEVNSDNPAV